jgi:hypothetical protein
MLAKVDMMNGYNELFVIALQYALTFTSSRLLFLWILAKKIYKDESIDFLWNQLSFGAVDFVFA